MIDKIKVSYLSRTIALLILSTLMLVAVVGCGYSIIGAEQKHTFYLNSIENHSQYMAMTERMKKNVIRYFQHMGLTDRDKADFIVDIYLDRVYVEDTSTSATREATGSEVTVAYRIIVSDKAGKAYYNARLEKVQSFSPRGAPSSYSNNLNLAFDKATDDLLNRFRYNFGKVTKTR